MRALYRERPECALELSAPATRISAPMSNLSDRVESAKELLSRLGQLEESL